MSSILPDHWPAMVDKFLMLVLVLERQIELGEFDSEKFDADWIELKRQGYEILTVLRKEPKDEWAETLVRLTAFRQAIIKLMLTCHKSAQPEWMRETLAPCNHCAKNVLDGLPRIDYVPEHVAEPEPIEGPAKALVASVELLPSPPWRKEISPSVKECLLAYLDEKIKYFSPVKTYLKRPEKLAELVRDEIDFAMKSEIRPFVPIEGRRPVGQSEGGIMRITFNLDKISTKRGRKPRES